MFKKSDAYVLITCAFCGLLILFRFAVYYPGDLSLLFNRDAHTRGSTTMLFYVWNLFLAGLPYFFVRLMGLIGMNHIPRKDELHSPRIPVPETNVYRRMMMRLYWGITLLWLLFLPNSPYIISDYIHLHPRAQVPYQFDVLLYFSCALTGLYLGGRSVVEFMRITQWKHWPNWGKWASLLIFPLCGFGIFLGRVLRWNSWDAFSRPTLLFTDMFSHLTDEALRPTVLFFTFAYGVALLASTLVIKSFSSHSSYK
ncbi:MAG: DUF1361 domain-containing protein [Bacteroidota bacterium]